MQRLKRTALEAKVNLKVIFVMFYTIWGEMGIKPSSSVNFSQSMYSECEIAGLNATSTNARTCSAAKS